MFYIRFYVIYIYIYIYIYVFLILKTSIAPQSIFCDFVNVWLYLCDVLSTPRVNRVSDAARLSSRSVRHWCARYVVVQVVELCWNRPDRRSNRAYISVNVMAQTIFVIQTVTLRVRNFVNIRLIDLILISMGRYMSLELVTMWITCVMCSELFLESRLSELLNVSVTIIFPI